MPRINNLNITTTDVCMEMCEGNPGAATVCGLALNNAKDIDPQSALGGLGVILGFDTMEIYGSHIWILYKDVCGENIVHLIAVMRAVQLGQITPSSVKKHIREAKPMDCEAILKDVMEKLTQFNRKQEAA